MASSSIHVQFPFPLSQNNSATIGITSQTKIFEIIKGCLLMQSRPELNPRDYYLVVHPQDEILLPFLSVNEYKKSLSMNSQVSFFLIPKMCFTVRLNIISVQVTTICDGNQKISNLMTQIRNASQTAKLLSSLSFGNKSLSIVNSTYISEPSSLVAFIKGQEVNIATLMNQILRNNHYKTPVISIKRQSTVVNLPNNQVLPVFKSTISVALARNKNAKIPYFLAKIFELVEKMRDTVGIYRKSGETTVIDSISKTIDTTADEQQLSAFLEKQAPHDLACTVKLYLRQLSEAIIPSYLVNDFYSVLSIQTDNSAPNSNEPANFSYNDNSKVLSVDDEMMKFKNVKFHTLPAQSTSPNDNVSLDSQNDKVLSCLRSLLRALPTPNYNLFQALCEHLEKIVDASNVNQMNYKNLSICIGTNIIRVSQGLDAVKETANAQSICQLILENWRKLFVSASYINKIPTYRVTKETIALPYDNQQLLLLEPPQIPRKINSSDSQKNLFGPRSLKLNIPPPQMPLITPPEPLSDSNNSSTATNSSAKINQSGSFDLGIISNIKQIGAPIKIQPDAVVALIDKNGGKIEGMNGQAWIVEYNSAFYKIDSSVLFPIVNVVSSIIPEPTEIVPLNPFGSISLKSIASRNYLQPDEQASLLSLNSNDASAVANKLQEIEEQINVLTDEYKLNPSSETCTKLKRLMRQLSSF